MEEMRKLKWEKIKKGSVLGMKRTWSRVKERQAFCRQLFGIIIGLSGLGLATYAAVSGQPWFGGTIGGATLVSLVSAFLYTRHQQKQELSQKRQQMQQVEQRVQNQKKKNRNR